MEAARSCDAEDTEKQINFNLVTGVHVHHKFEFQFMQILKLIITKVLFDYRWI